MVKLFFFPFTYFFNGVSFIHHSFNCAVIYFPIKLKKKKRYLQQNNIEFRAFYPQMRVWLDQIKFQFQKDLIFIVL